VSITGASNGTGTYTYSISSQKNSAGTAVTYFTISGTTITIAASTPVGAYTVSVTAKDSNSGKTKAAAMTITVQYPTLTLNGNGGTVTKSPVYPKYGTTSEYTAATGSTAATIGATRTGYALNGWYTAASGGTKVLNADGTGTGTAVSNYTNASKNWVMTANQTLYAQWTEQIMQNTTTSKYYERLEVAVSEAATGQTIELLKNYNSGSGDIIIGSGKTITINLNGYELYPVANYEYNIIIEASSKLYVKGTGKLILADMQIQNSGIFAKSGGAELRGMIWSHDVKPMIVNNSGASMVITSCPINYLSQGADVSSTPAVQNSGKFTLDGNALFTTDGQFIKNTGTLEILQSASVKGSQTSMILQTAGTTTINSSGTIECTKSGRGTAIRIESGTLTLGTNDTVVNEAPIIKSTYIAVQTLSGTTFNYYDGKLIGSSGNTLSALGTVKYPTGYTTKKNVTTEGETMWLVQSSSGSSTTSSMYPGLSSPINNNFSVNISGNNTGEVGVQITPNTNNQTAVQLPSQTEQPKEPEQQQTGQTEQPKEPEQQQQTGQTEKPKEEKKLVQIADKQYTSIQEAINASKNEDIIEVIEDISLTEEIIIEKDKNIKLKLNGKTLTSTSINTLNNKGTLTIISNGIIKNESDNGVVINNSGILLIEDVIITTAKNGGKGIYNDGELSMKSGKIVTEGIGAIAIYNNNKAKAVIEDGIIEVRGFGSKGIYNNSELTIDNIEEKLEELKNQVEAETGNENSQKENTENGNTSKEGETESLKEETTKIIVASDDSIGLYNSTDAKICNINSVEIILEAEEIENYELIKNTDEFKEELEQMKPSYGIYNDSDIEVNIMEVIIKVERLKGIGILNNLEGSIILGTNDETLDTSLPIIYAISDNTTAIVNKNVEKGKIKYYDGAINTTVSIKNIITEILENSEIVENIGKEVINTTLKIIEEKTQEKM